MSNATPLVLGLAGGLALWHFVPKPPTTKTLAPRNAQRSTCGIQLDASGLIIDGEHVELAEAIRRAQLAGLALVVVTPDAPASLDAALMNGLRMANVPVHARTQVASMRNATAETFSSFTLVVYPQGIGGSRKTTRWFQAITPMTWQTARDQLAAAKFIDADAISPAQAGYWKLVTDPRVFNAKRAKPFPEAEIMGHRGAKRSSRYGLDGGRIITRDGQALVRIERVDLGDARYALSPHETDKLGARLVRSLNEHGAS